MTIPRVLCVGDPHLPCGKDGYLKFCKRMAKQYRTNTTVIMGDITDNHGISFHLRNPEAPGTKDEYKYAKQLMRPWYRAFPDAYVCIGNHDARPMRLAQTVGIPASFLRDYADLWDTPGWKWVDNVIINDVYYVHSAGTGKTPAFNLSKDIGMSCVVGHAHSVAGVRWSVSPTKRWFGLDTGCGIDDDKWAFAYAKGAPKRSVVALGVVIGDHAYTELMPL